MTGRSTAGKHVIRRDPSGTNPDRGETVRSLDLGPQIGGPDSRPGVVTGQAGSNHAPAQPRGASALVGQERTVR